MDSIDFIQISFI